MAVLGIDYSFARPGVPAIKAAGYKFVCRYLASASGKAVTPAEAQALKAGGLPLVVVFEDYANQALKGRAQGVADAHEALTQANALGLPADRPIYFAVDFDASEAQQAAIDDYFRGVASVIGLNRTGVYGGFYVVKRCHDNGTAKWFWQTVAWSGGQVFAGVHIYQNGQSAFAGGADVDEARQSDYGQWPKGVTPMQDAEIIKLIQTAWGRNPTNPELAQYRQRDALDLYRGVINDPQARMSAADVARAVLVSWDRQPTVDETNRYTKNQGFLQLKGILNDPQTDAARKKVEVPAPTPTPAPDAAPSPAPAPAEQPLPDTVADIPQPVQPSGFQKLVNFLFGWLGKK